MMMVLFLLHNNASSLDWLTLTNDNRTEPAAYALAMCKFTFSFRCTPVRTKLCERTKPVLVFVGMFLWLSQFQLLLFGTRRQRQDYRYRSSVLVELPGPNSSVPLVWRVVHPASCQLCRYHSDIASPSLRIHSATSHNQQDGNGHVQLSSTKIRAGKLLRKNLCFQGFEKIKFKF